MITVIAALIERDHKFLIARRTYGDEGAVNKWEFPGGKIEPGEIEEKTIEREIKEELELNIQALNYLCNSIYEYPNRTIEVKLYKCIFISGEIKLHDHSEYKWVAKEELLDYDFTLADTPLAKFVSEDKLI